MTTDPTPAAPSTDLDRTTFGLADVATVVAGLLNATAPADTQSDTTWTLTLPGSTSDRPDIHLRISDHWEGLYHVNVQRCDGCPDCADCEACGDPANREGLTNLDLSDPDLTLRQAGSRVEYEARRLLARIE
ncbi:hypothetical protein AB0D08_06585 [Kitasatospora sp. NPDC048540]|uniref:hypothetical protein n=1 Tax=Kitasatospora sp. NPDC048540 TaxID=3155634 RepID=UPI0033D3E767